MRVQTRKYLKEVADDHPVKQKKDTTQIRIAGFK